MSNKLKFEGKVWSFGHYDSRGGGAIVVGARHVVHAMDAYGQFFGNTAEEMDEYGYEGAYDDLQDGDGVERIYVFDKELSRDLRDSELDARYGGPYKLAKIRQKYGGSIGILWVGKLPPTGDGGELLRASGLEDLVREAADKAYLADMPDISSITSKLPSDWEIEVWNPGEDAYGLLLIWA